MPTLQQELNKMNILTHMAYDDEPGKELTAVAEPVSKKMSKTHIVWEFIQQNPSSTVQEIAAGLGFARGDTSSYTSQLIERGLVIRVKHDGAFCYTTAVEQFPVYTKEMRSKNLAMGWEARRSMKNKTKRVLVKRKDKPMPVQAAPVLEQRKQQILSGVTNEFNYSVNTFISQLNVHQAKAVYEELKKLFGG